MTTSFQCKAYAKLNLTLDVLGKRSDGYHEVETIMTSVGYYDDVNIILGAGEGITVTVDHSEVPADGNNLAVKAAELFFAVAGIKQPGISINIVKRIPPGSGMAGGSSDAAAVLRALNEHYNMVFSESRLRSLGAEIGSDVPYCITYGTAFATGRGEILTPLDGLRPCWFTVACPDFWISTKTMFDKLGEVDITQRPDNAAAIRAINSGDLEKLGSLLCNVFEQADCRPEIFEIKETLLKSGALGASMTGTGSAVYGLFDTKEKADFAAYELSRKYKTVFVAKNTQ